MKLRTHFGISAIAARNIRKAREDGKGISRAELAEWMNFRGPGPGDPPMSADAKLWNEQNIVNLEHGHKGRTPNLSIDDLLSVCQKLDVTLFDLLLPDKDALLYGRISAALFGFELTDTTLNGLRVRSDLAEKLQYHPEVVEAGWKDEVDYWMRAWESTQAFDTGDAPEAEKLRKESDQAAVRKDGHRRLEVDRLISLLSRGDEPEPDTETTNAWHTAWATRLMELFEENRHD